MTSIRGSDKFAAHSGIYLLNHSVGRPLVNVGAIIEQEFINPWESEIEVWSVWLEAIEKFRSRLGSLFNAQADEFCPQTNLSSALTKILYSLPPKNDCNTILYSEEDFPSIGFVLEKAQALGYRLKYIPRTEDLLDLATWDKYLSKEVGLVLVTHAYSNTGCLAPAEGILKLARERGIISVLDVAQSAGVVPIDLQVLQPNFMIGSSVKWLCGGPGAGYLWVHPETIQRCEPLDVGWFSHQNPFEFDIHDFRYAEGAMRFWGGTPSVIPYVVAAESITQIMAIGLKDIRQYNQGLTQRVVKAVEENVVSPIDPEQRGGTLVLNFGARQEQICERLTAANIYFDTRATGIRISPHVYNSSEEISLVLDCLQ